MPKLLAFLNDIIKRTQVLISFNKESLAKVLLAKLQNSVC